MLKTIRPEEALLGMYVQSFGGSWMSHPFWRPRFLISSAENLARIRTSGVEVVIDTAKGRDVVPRQGRKAAVVVPVRPSARFGRADRARSAELARRSTSVVKALFDDCRLGRGVATADILATVDDIADALTQNMSAFLSVTRLKAKDDYTYTHSVAVCALMISLARETGAPPDVVRDLGMAGLLHDIGKIAVSDDILSKSGLLNDAEMAEMRRHPAVGHAILTAASGVPPVALDVCLHHHERPDGTGYPFGLEGDAISRATRMASVCDVYDALTSIRTYKKSMTPLEAITEMDVSDGQFDREVLFSFMQGIGVYPEGKLVRLRCNRLAVTLPPNRDGFGPVFRAFYSTVDSKFIHYENVILGDCQANEDAVSAEDPAAWFSADWPTMAARIIAGKGITR